jgi:inositol hexakisphosphate/diphosphoinositol-pentakisphosphate kinase
MLAKRLGLIYLFSRVNLPKSFLAVNLAESHTFHKKEAAEAVDLGVLAEEEDKKDEEGERLGGEGAQTMQVERGRETEQEMVGHEERLKTVQNI